MNTQSESIKEIAKALVSAQSEIKPAKKDAKNPFHKNTYATLLSVWEACSEALNKNGIAVVQGLDHGDVCGNDQIVTNFTGDQEKTTVSTQEKTSREIVVVTKLLHISGEWMESRLHLNPKAHDPQAIGSAITYGRRYALAAMVGVCVDDDDGEAASGRPGQQQGASAPKKPASPQRQAQGSKPMTDGEFKNNIMALKKNYGLNNEQVLERLKVAKLGDVAAEHRAQAVDVINQLGIDWQKAVKITGLQSADLSITTADQIPG